MVLESIVICVDNSEYMRNEDFLPNRMRAQIDAVQVILYAKLRSSPENYLSLVTMANNRVLTNLTNQEAKLLSDLNRMAMEGCIRLLPSLNVSQLVLKHRPIKHAKCRIIVFVGSPVVENEVEFVALGKKFKKENVTVDIITFGCEPGVGVLRSFVNILNGPSGTNSSFHTVPSNLVVSDYVVSSGLVAAHREFDAMPDDVDDDEELRRAIEWSMLESGGQSSVPPTAQPTGIQDGNDLSDDEQLRIAIQLSIQEAERLEALLQEPQQMSNQRTTTPDIPVDNVGTIDAAKPDSTSGTDTTNSTDPNPLPANTTNNSKNNKENNNPPNTNPNNTNSNPNHNNHNAAAPSNSDTGKPAGSENKEVKKTILTKKR